MENDIEPEGMMYLLELLRAMAHVWVKVYDKLVQSA